tara:strand:- start:1048 stop:1299 length:252 start_codon:yes stop_codon:yes gene_type:complete
MTKNQLINNMYSAKLDIEYIIKQLQFRVNFNNVEKLKGQYQDDDHGVYQAQMCGALEAWNTMSVGDMNIAIKNLQKTLEKLNN